MPSRSALSAPDRDFCTLVSQAAFANPFGDEFAAIYRAIEGAADRQGDDQRKTIASAVAARADKLERAGLANIRNFSGADREILRLFFVLDVYYRWHDAFDGIVTAQFRAGGEPVEVPFARDALAVLMKRGIPREEAVRLFGILFQVRRAHHFIVEGLVGCSPCMAEFRRRLWNNVFTHDIGWYERKLWNRMEEFSTLLLGETGTGKGAAAAAIGRSAFIPFDERRGAFAESFTNGFHALNLSQFPESLIESELFGHRKGAFTGAIEAHEGVFARCSPYGAIFLDEIGDVPIPIQIKLLHVLQERNFSPVGSHERRRFRGRVITATHKPLVDLRERGLFRDDFYYRLCSDAITVPPLRQRLSEDPRELDELLAHVLTRLVGDADPALLAFVRKAIQDSVGAEYAWPGNVRELEQAVRRILLARRYVPDTKTTATDPARILAEAVIAGSLDADTLFARYCALIHSRTRNVEETARRTKLDRRTVQRYLRLA